VADQLNKIFEQPQGSADGGSGRRFPWDWGPSTNQGQQTAYAGLKRNIVVPDVRTNSVIVTATEQNLKAFEELGAHKVYGRIPALNEAARKAVIYNGWRQEGVLRRHVRRGDELIDVELWGGFREDLPEPPDE
jgi:hypothetical protein